MPHVRPLGDKVWEMRLRDAGGIARAIHFTTSGRRIVVLHAFEKRTQRTRRRSLDLTKRRMQEFLSSDTELR
jgi:phage-related protein